jgi:PAS domain S-box-containing protein
MAEDVLAQRIEAVEQHLQRLRDRAQARPKQQPLLDPAVEDLALALDSLQAARHELQRQEERERLLAQVSEDRQLIEDLVRSLEQERQTLQTIMENTPTQLAYLDPNLNFVRVNAAYAEGSGHTKEDLIGRYHFDLFPNPENQAIFEGVRDTGQPVSYQARPFEYVDQPERGITYWDWTLVPVKDQAGETLGLVISLADVTEQRHTEERLRFKADILAQIADAVVAWDDDEKVTYLNQRATDLYGVDKDKALNCQLDDLYRIEWLAPDAEREASTALQERGYWQGKQVHVTTNGTRMHVESSVRVLEDPQGTAAGFLATTHDVTAQKEAEAERDRLLDEIRGYSERLEGMVARRTVALQASQARLQAIFDGAAIGIALTDVKGRILECNPALEAMLGYQDGELCGLTFTEITHPQDVTAAVASFQELVSGKRQGYRLDKRYVRRDGDVIWARLTVSLLQSGQGAGFAIGLIEDITEQKKIRDALLKTEKLAIAGQLGASLAHEINNPLQSVIGCLGLAEKNLAEGADVSRYIHVARQELRRAAGIVAQLRDLHRLSEPESKQPTDLDALLEEVLLLCKKKCEECKIKAIWHGAGDLPPIPVVQNRMRQVFLNLILNALDATSEGGQVAVTTVQTAASETEPAGVRITFADSGSGIADDYLPHLFEPFYSTKPQGLGLGLYITHEIVKAHGGRIDVSSRLGEGTAFSVWLPNGTAREDKQ